MWSNKDFSIVFVSLSRTVKVLINFTFSLVLQKLKELAVAKLVLPAVPSLINTWTTSFGFTKMTSLERLQYLDYTFLDFQDTTMCQKHLLESPSAVCFLRGICCDHSL